MKILFFAHESQLYGANRSLLNLLHDFNRRDIRSYIILPQDGPLCKELKNLGINFKIVKFHWWASSPKISFWRQPKQYLIRLKSSILKVKTTYDQLYQIRNIALNFNPDIVYSNSSVIWTGLAIAKMIKKPHVWHIREFKDLDHNLHLDFGNWVFKRSLKLSNHIIFISNSIKNHVYPEIRRNYSIIYNAVGSLSEFNKYRSINGHMHPVCTFLIIGSIQAGKGQKDAIQAFHDVRKAVNNIRLLIAGKGDTQTLWAMVHELNLVDDVEILGHVDDPHLVYARANVVLMCSKNEGFGRVTAEAMMHSIPVIGYNNGGTKEIIIDNETGFLYNTIETLVDKMKLLATNPSLCKSLGENGWRHAAKEFSSEMCAGAIYEQLKLLRVPKDACK